MMLAVGRKQRPNKSSGDHCIIPNCCSWSIVNIMFLPDHTKLAVSVNLEGFWHFPINISITKCFLTDSLLLNISLYCCWQWGNYRKKWITIKAAFESSPGCYVMRHKWNSIRISPNFVYIFHKLWSCCWKKSGELLNENWQAPINHTKSWIDNKYILNYE